jgi:hypothetical protein
VDPLAAVNTRAINAVTRSKQPRFARAVRRLVVGISALVLCGVCLNLARADQGDGFINREYPLKALFLYNFGGYVEWPDHAFADAQQPFVIGVLGNAPVNAMLHEIAASKQVAGRRIEVKQFTSPDLVGPCHILFVARDVSSQHAGAVIERLRGLPVLTVGETAGFAQRDGCVNFYIEANKIRFEINLQAAKQQQLRISAKLLALSRIVE